MSTKKSNTPSFEVSEKVICPYRGEMYEAKVLEMDEKTKTCKVHYTGWNARHDEWVQLSTLAKWTETKVANVQRRGSKQQRHDKEKSNSRPSTPASGDGRKRNKPDNVSDSGSDLSKRRKVGSTLKDSVIDTPPHVESFLEYRSRPSIQIKIPDDLKPVLVDDWDLITRQYKYLHLPARQSVSQILDDFIRTKLGNGASASSKVSQLSEVILGIKDYFNAMLGTQLLYKFERLQYSELIEKNKGTPMVDLYGAVHLLRLFVRFGNVLAYTPLSEKQVDFVLGYVHDLIKYVQQHKSSLFKPEDYETGPPEYQRMAFS